MNSDLDQFNERCSRLLAELRSALPISEELRGRLVTHAPRFAFGFTGIKLTAYSNSVGGQLLCALMPRAYQLPPPSLQRHGRFFATSLCSLERGGEPRCLEYRSGDMFETEATSLQLEDVADMDLWDDARLRQYLNDHLSVMHATVERVAAEWTEPVKIESA